MGEAGYLLVLNSIMKMFEIPTSNFDAKNQLNFSQDCDLLVLFCNLYKLESFY